MLPCEAVSRPIIPVLRDGSRGLAKRQYLDIFPKKLYPFLPGGINALRTFQDAVQFIEVELARMVYGNASKRGENRKNKALMDEAYGLGRKIVTE